MSSPRGWLGVKGKAEWGFVKLGHTNPTRSNSGLQTLVLLAYRGLGVREVWIWQKQCFHIFRLGDAGYEASERSEFIPELDFESLARFVEEPNQHAALKAFRDELRASTAHSD